MFLSLQMIAASGLLLDYSVLAIAWLRDMTMLECEQLQFPLFQNPNPLLVSRKRVSVLVSLTIYVQRVMPNQPISLLSCFSLISYQLPSCYSYGSVRHL